MRTTETDALGRAVRHYIRNEDENWFLRPIASTPDRSCSSGDFTGVESCCCSPGLVLWFPHLIPWSLRYVRYCGRARPRERA